jgi:hypothetical protein
MMALMNCGMNLGRGCPRKKRPGNGIWSAKRRTARRKRPPDKRPGWKRWYFIYHQPVCTNVKISADRDPHTGEWFNPHESSGEI